MKRLFVWFMAVVLGLCLFSAPFALAADTEASYSGQIEDFGGSIPPDGQWTEREGGLGAVRVSKAITPVAGENENYFDITLTAQAKQIEVDKSISVVIVMDVSNTMNTVDEDVSTQSRVKNAKAAANQFIKQFCEHQGLDEDRQIGVVAFNTNARWEIPLEKGNANSASDVAALQKKVNNIVVSPDMNNDPNHVRFTNIEGGLQLAYEQLKSDDAANKFVIVLTDGFPTTYVKSYDSVNKTITGYDTYTPNAKESKVGHFYDEVAKKPVGYGTNYSDRAASRAQDKAQAMKSDGINIFSVGISIGQQTIKGYVDAITTNNSTVDRESTRYVIGSASDPNAYRKWLGGSIGGGPNLSGEGHVSYSDGDNAKELESAYSSFLNEIILTQASPLTSFYTEDPMGQNIEFLHFYDQHENPAEALKGKAGKGEENTASFDAATKTILWNKLKSGYELTTEKIDGQTVNVYTYTLKYRVRLANEASGFVFGEDYYTNADAELRFASEVIPEAKTIPYPDPAVEGYKGSFSFAKMTDSATPGNHDDDVPLQGAEFVLSHSDACSICAAEIAKGSISAKVDIPAMVAASEADGSVSFDGIPSGHEYVLAEVATPPDHELNHNTSKVVVSYGGTVVEVGEQNDTGVLLVKKDAGSDVVVSHNHRLAPAEIEIEGAKRLYVDGDLASSLPDGAYKFKLSAGTYTPENNGDLDSGIAVASIPMPQGATSDTYVVSNDDFDVNFGKITYTIPGTYTYTITELAPEVGSDYGYVGHDTRTCNVIVVVDTVPVDNASDTLRAVATYRWDDGSTVPEPIFENKVQSVTAKLKARKVMTDNEGEEIAFPSDLEGAFTFQLLDEGGRIICEATNDAAGNVEFEGLKYTQPGTYEYAYTISEVASDDNSYIYDDSVYKATVVVSADDDYSTGELSADVIYADSNGGNLGGNAVPVFKNKLRTPAELALGGYKTLDGEAAGGFEFVLTGVGVRDFSGKPIEGAIPPMPNGASGGVYTATSANDGLINFGTLKFDREGTYLYTVEEKNLGDSSIIYSTIVHDLVVVVKADEESDALKATLFDDGHEHDGTHDDPITFANATRHPGYAKINVAKTLIGDSDLAGGEFQFKLTPVNGAPMPDAQLEEDGGLVVSNDESGSATFGLITYAKEGTYTYHVSELKGDVPGMVYDETVHDVTVVVAPPADGGQGAFEVSMNIENCENDGNFGAGGDFEIAFVEGAAEFVNVDTTARVPLAAYKTMDGNPAKASEFAFQLLDEKGNLVQEVRNAEGGVVRFEDLTFTEPGVHHYTIVELNEGKLGVNYDSEVFYVEVKVEKAQTEVDGESYEVLEAVCAIDGKNFTQSDEPWFKNTTSLEGTKDGSAKTGDPINLLVLGVIAVLAAAAAGVSLYKLRKC